MGKWPASRLMASEAWRCSTSIQIDIAKGAPTCTAQKVSNVTNHVNYE